MAFITNSNNLLHFIKILNYQNSILILIQLLLHFIMIKFSEFIFIKIFDKNFNFIVIQFFMSILLHLLMTSPGNFGFI